MSQSEPWKVWYLQNDSIVLSRATRIGPNMKTATVTLINYCSCTNGPTNRSVPLNSSELGNCIQLVEAVVVEDHGTS